jgi:hypothetical protein
MVGLRYLRWGAALALAFAALVVAAQEDAPAGPPDPNPTGQWVAPRHEQSLAQQLADEWECYDRACEQTDWEPYAAYDELVAAGYAVELSRQEMEAGLIHAAMEGAVTGSVAGELLRRPRRGAEIGLAIAVALELVRNQYLLYQDDPSARRAVDGYRRELRTWERKFAACLRPKGYRVTAPEPLDPAAEVLQAPTR